MMQGFSHYQGFFCFTMHECKSTIISCVTACIARIKPGVKSKRFGKRRGICFDMLLYDVKVVL